MEDVLRILEQDSTRSNKNIARMLGITEDEVAEQISELEKRNVIVGYKTLINWDKTDREVVDAFIELKITPQRGEGFDKVAERIYKYPQVKTVYLMSGTHDLAVMIEGRTMKEVALFVAEKLAPMDSVISTSTSFVLKKYKQEGIVFEDDEKDTRQVITL
ncbi:MAG: Lrp/AsnC family transcriptional regulator [Clostridia bacterium]|nr:Lrp/AsnC family transcriptional regulator [Clostridia bacterium]